MSEKLVHLTIIISTGLVKATGESFRKASVKGAFLNTEAVNHDAPIDREARYTIRGSEIDKIIKDHKRDGKYRLYFKAGDCWIDERPDKIEKHIIRVKNVETVEWRGEVRSLPKNETVSIEDE